MTNDFLLGEYVAVYENDLYENKKTLVGVGEVKKIGLGNIVRVKKFTVNFLGELSNEGDVYQFTLMGKGKGRAINLSIEKVNPGELEEVKKEVVAYVIKRRKEFLKTINSF